MGSGGVSGIKGAYYLTLSPDEKTSMSVQRPIIQSHGSTGMSQMELLSMGASSHITAPTISQPRIPPEAQVSSDGKTFYQLGGSSDDIVWMSRNPVTGALLYQKSGPTYDVTHGDINKKEFP